MLVLLSQVFGYRLFSLWSVRTYTPITPLGNMSGVRVSLALPPLGHVRSFGLQ